MGVNNNFPQAPLNVSATDKYLEKMKTAVNNSVVGKLNCCGEATLIASASSTVITDNNCNENSVVLLTPLTFNAANRIADMYVVPSNKQFTIHHTSHTDTDRTFRYVVIG